MPIPRSFRKNIEESSENHKSNIVLALDLVVEDSNLLLSKTLKLLEQISKYVCAIKVNRHLILPLGLEKIRIIVDTIHSENLPVIMDCKINDIGSTNMLIAHKYFDVGFDAVIANPFVGWNEGLAPVFQTAKKLGKGVILLTYMSHGGASEGYGQRVIDEKGEIRFQYSIFAERALKWKADGVVVGATYPKKIKEVKDILQSRIPIYSPGIGAQGGKITDALNAGTDYLIIGRSIVQSENPEKVIKQLLTLVKKSK